MRSVSARKGIIIMALNPLYITSVNLESYMVDKSTGEPLSGGIVTFYQDSSRTTGKVVFELSGNPPNYTYSALPNPLILSDVGTFQDASGNNVAVYYYPYDANGAVQLYYITVTDALGVEQFTREAWPSNAAGAAAVGSSLSNQIANPQFAQVLFIPGTPLVIPFTGAGSLSVGIAPGWALNITYASAGSVTVTQNSIVGATAYPFNPPYTLTITPTGGITSLVLTQTLSNNPSVFAPQVGGLNGFIGASILLAPNSSVTMQYAPSTGAPQTILTANNLTGVYTEYDTTTQLLAASNTDNSNVGFVNINLILSTTQPTTFGNVQILPLQNGTTTFAFDQMTVNQQINQLFYYYNPLLQYKPISSFLVGWDFPLNPAQFLTTTGGPFATGANTSNYVWDQTIVFQTITNGFTFTRADTHTGSAGLQLGIAAHSSVAVIQYLDLPTAKQILNQMASVTVAGVSTEAGGIQTTISLWACTNANLPNMNANTSLVATLSATGKPATLNGAWIEIPRSNLGDATFALLPSATMNYSINGFTGWEFPSKTIPNTANFFAIVVGFVNPTAGIVTLNIESISCVPGSIPTIPAPQTIDEVYRECCRYWNSSFAPGVLPATGLGVNGAVGWNTTRAGTQPNHASNYIYPAPMRVIPPVTFYNPTNANAQAFDTQVGAGDCSSTTLIAFSAKSFNVSASGNAGGIVGDYVAVHYTADARLGII